MKWITLPYSVVWDGEFPEDKIHQPRILKMLGARMHPDPVRQQWIYRLAYFSCYHNPRPMESGRGFSIPIPFMKNDHGVIIY